MKESPNCQAAGAVKKLIQLSFPSKLIRQQSATREPEPGAGLGRGPRRDKEGGGHGRGGRGDHGMEETRGQAGEVPRSAWSREAQALGSDTSARSLEMPPPAPGRGDQLDLPGGRINQSVYLWKCSYMGAWARSRGVFAGVAWSLAPGACPAGLVTAVLAGGGGRQQAPSSKGSGALADTPESRWDAAASA